MDAAIAFGAVWAFAAGTSVLMVAGAGLAGRRVLLDRGGASVACGVRRPGGAWRLGVASYGATALRWHRAVGISLAPSQTFARRALDVTERRPAEDWEEARLGQGMVVLSCRVADGETVDLAVPASALTGFLAWVESAPPGSHVLHL